MIEVYGNSDFILDLTTVNDLLNPEMDSFFDQNNGYANWRNFLEGTFNGRIVPCLQYEEAGSREDFQKQTSALVSRFGKVALRTSVFDAEAATLYAWALEVTGEKISSLWAAFIFWTNNLKGFIWIVVRASSQG